MRFTLSNRKLFLLLAFLFASLSFIQVASAHGVEDDDKAFIQSTTGPRLIPFAYLGAKHMVTGYDHLLFLVGVIFFLYRQREIMSYVTLFAVGHSVTLLFGVFSGMHVSAYIVDAIIGLSVVYKLSLIHISRSLILPCCAAPAFGHLSLSP